MSSKIHMPSTPVLFLSNQCRRGRYKTIAVRWNRADMPYRLQPTMPTNSLGWLQVHIWERAVDAAAMQDIALKVVKLPQAKRGFVLLPPHLAVATVP